MVTNDMNLDAYFLLGLLLLLLAILPSTIHYGICYLNHNKIHNQFTPKNYPNITLFLPVKNESEVIINKLEEILSMDYDKNLISILIVDSGSTDNTALIASEFLKSKDIDIKWELKILDRR